MSICGHPKLTEIDQLTALEVSMEGQQGNIVGMFTWKKYTCDSCGKLITILQAVVEDIDA